MARPVVHGLRAEYQDRVNFVVLDYDQADDHGLASDLGVARHPALGVVAPDSDAVVERIFGPLPEERLRALLDEAIERHGG